MPFPDDRDVHPQSQLPGIQDQRYIQHAVKIAVDIEIAKVRAEMTAALKAQSDNFELYIKSAFPDGDLGGHKRFHDQLVEEDRDRKALYKDIRNKAVSGVFWVALVLVGTAIWEYFKREVGK